MYSPRLYKYRDSYVLYDKVYITTVHFGSLLLTHTLLVKQHTYMTFPPPGARMFRTIYSNK